MKVLNEHYFSKSAKYMLISVMVTSIGNGIQLLTAEKMLYDSTGSPLYLGFLLIFEYFTNTLLQLFSGSIVDRGSEKEAAVYCNLAGNLLHDSTQDTKNSRFIILN